MNTIDPKDVYIPNKYTESIPKRKNIVKALNYIEKYNTIDQPIIIDGNGWLVDGYLNYYVWTEILEREDPIPYSLSKKIIPDCPVIAGRYLNSETDYYWLNDKNLDIKVGDTLLVESQDNFSFIKCTGVDCHMTATKHVIENITIENAGLWIYAIAALNYIGVPMSANMDILESKKTGEVCVLNTSNNELIRLDDYQTEIYEAIGKIYYLLGARE